MSDDQSDQKARLNAMLRATMRRSGEIKMPEIIHDEHGPAAPQIAVNSPTSLGASFEGLRQAGRPAAVTADFRDEKIEALTTLVTEMGAIIAEQSVKIADVESECDNLERTVAGLAARLNALHQIVSDGEVNEAVENFQLVNSQLSRLRVRVDALEAAPTGRNPNLDAVEHRMLEANDPTMRAMSSLRAKGLA